MLDQDMTKSPRLINRLLTRISSISSIERVTDKLNPRAQHTKTVDEEFEDLVEEFDAIEAALRSFIESNEHFVLYLKETLKSSERAANLLRLLTYQELLVTNSQEGSSWDRTKSYLAVLNEILFSVNDSLDSFSSIVNKKIEILAGFSKKIGEKISFRDKALSNYDRVYEKYDQMTIQTASQKLSPKELQRYNQLESKMRSLKREFDSWNSILKLELPTYFILVRNFTEPLVFFSFYTHLTVAYQYKLNLQSIMPQFDAQKVIFEPEFSKIVLDQFKEVSKKFPIFKSDFDAEKLIVPTSDAEVANGGDDADGESVESQDNEKPSVVQSHRRVEYCRALFNFSTDDKDDLKFAKGDLIQVIDRKGEWWIGQFKGKKGLFPSNYVESNDKTTQ